MKESLEKVQTAIEQKKTSFIVKFDGFNFNRHLLDMALNSAQYFNMYYHTLDEVNQYIQLDQLTY